MASSALANSTRNPSPIVLISLPSCFANIGLTESSALAEDRDGECFILLGERSVPDHVDENDCDEPTLR